MGVCESSKEKEKIISKTSQKININNNNIQNNSSNDDDNLNGLDTHPSTNKQDNEIKPPELAKYEKDGKKSELSIAAKSKVISVFSSQNEEELIIRNEVNKNIVNKDGDFDNMDFKNLVKKNGGIVIKDNDKMSNILSYQGLNPAFNIGKPNVISEIKSMNTVPAKMGKIDDNNLLQNINNKDLLRLSYKINVSFHDNAQKNDACINIPKTDEPLPDMDELSTESPILIRNSLSSL